MRKTWARIPAQSKAYFFPQNDLKFSKIENTVRNVRKFTEILCNGNVKLNDIYALRKQIL